MKSSSTATKTLRRLSCYFTKKGSYSKKSDQHFPFFPAVRIKGIGGEIITWRYGKQMVHHTVAELALGKGFIALHIHAGGGINGRWKDFTDNGAIIYSRLSAINVD
ncbi:MAG: hypothetical protein ABIN89_30610 [Chitinophagaceae bacterium]